MPASCRTSLMILGLGKNTGRVTLSHQISLNFTCWLTSEILHQNSINSVDWLIVQIQKFLSPQPYELFMSSCVFIY